MNILEFLKQYLGGIDKVYEVIIVIDVVLFYIISIRPHIKEFVVFLKDGVNFIYTLLGIRKRTKKTDNYLEPSKILSRYERHQISILFKEMKIKIKSLNFGDRKRNEIFNKIVDIVIESFDKNIREFIISNDIDSLDKEEFMSKIVDLLSQVSDDMNDMLKYELGHDVYELLINSDKGIRKWMRNTTDAMIVTIKELTKYNFITMNHVLFDIVLTTLSSYLMIFISGIEEQYKYFNGDLSKIIDNQ
jgi:hypothetical protein